LGICGNSESVLGWGRQAGRVLGEKGRAFGKTPKALELLN